MNSPNQQPLSKLSDTLSYGPHSLWFHLSQNNHNSTHTHPVVHKVELSQKQAMRRDDFNIRVSSGVKYQLKFKGVGLENVQNVEARLGRVGSLPAPSFTSTTPNSSQNDHERNHSLSPVSPSPESVTAAQLQKAPIHWMDFSKDRPIDFFEASPVAEVPSTKGSSSAESPNYHSKDSPTSAYSVQSSESTNSSPQQLKVSFSLKKFSQIKKIDKTLPPAKKITFVLSVRFSSWPGEARVYFKFSTRSKAESSKEWKLEKVLDNRHHPNLIHLEEPSLATTSGSVASPMSTSSASSSSTPHLPQMNIPSGMMYGHNGMNSGSGSSAVSSNTNNGVPPSFGNSIHQNMNSRDNSVSPAALHPMQQQQQNQFLTSAQMNSLFPMQQQQQSMMNSGTPQQQQQQPQFYMNQNIFNASLQQSMLNSTNAQQQQHFHQQSTPTNPEQQFTFYQQQDSSNPLKMDQKSNSTSRKRSRETFTQDSFDAMLQRSAKKKSLENQLDSLARDEGPANKVHPTTGIGRFYSLKAPVFIYFGSCAGQVQCITPTEISLLVPSHEPTIKAINVTVQNADRVPITSFAQYRFVADQEGSESSDGNSVSYQTSNKGFGFGNQNDQVEDNFFRDFDLDLPMDSIFDATQIGAQFSGLDSLGQSLLHRAAAVGHSRLVLRLLLAERFSPYHRDNIGRTAFHIACARGQTDVAKILLYFGGATLYFAEDYYSMIGVDLAASCNQSQLVERLHNWVLHSDLQTQYFDDVERFCNDWPVVRNQTRWPYDKHSQRTETSNQQQQRGGLASSSTEEDSRMKSLEQQNRRLRDDLERSQKRSRLLELRMKQRFINTLRQESTERRTSRVLEAQAPEVEPDPEDMAPLPEMELELLANAQQGGEPEPQPEEAAPQ